MAIYWFILGTVQLSILTFQDLFNKMLVDDRHNYFMMGATISLISFFRQKWWYILTTIIVIILLSILITRYKLIGSADTKTILWSFVGFAIIDHKFLTIFAIYLIVLLIISSLSYKILVKFKAIKEIKHYPAYPSFLGSFIITILTYNKFY